MLPTPYVASLRVFEPLEAFDPVDRLRWQSLSADHNSREEEQRLALERVIFPQPPNARPDGAHLERRNRHGRHRRSSRSRAHHRLISRPWHERLGSRRGQSHPRHARICRFGRDLQIALKCAHADKSYW